MVDTHITLPQTGEKGHMDDVKWWSISNLSGYRSQLVTILFLSVSLSTGYSLPISLMLCKLHCVNYFLVLFPMLLFVCYVV